MRKLIIGALLGAQLQVAPPVFAAGLEPAGDQRTGAFGGVRIRLPFGGASGDRQLRAGLTLAPVRQDRFASGETRLRIGEGFEFGLNGRGPAHFSIAGRDLRRLAAQGNERGGGVPTGLWIAGGLVLVTVLVVGAAALALEDAGDED